jgi:hypothetical protein
MCETKKYINKKYVAGKKFSLEQLEELKNTIDKYEYDDTTWAIENFNQQKVAEERNGRVWEVIRGITFMIKKIQKIEGDSYLRFQFLENGKYHFYCEYDKEMKIYNKDVLNEIWESC